VRIAAFLFAALFALDAAAGSKEEAWLIDHWRAKTAESAEALKKGDYARSLRIADALIAEMMEQLGPGEGLRHPPEAPAAPGGSGNMTAPQVLKRVEFLYPLAAYELGVRGDLVLRVIITKEGTVASPHIVRPLSAPTLSFAALEGVKQWRFVPGRLNGQPVDVPFNLTISFKK
jgi:protein TonB